MKAKIKNLSSVMAAFLSTNWAIESGWLDNAYAVLKNSNGEFVIDDDAEKSALRAIAGDRPEGTRYTIIPDNSRIAIIEIWGAIFPRANVYTEYCGGTSSELLVKDIKAAKNNPAIDETVFLFHSPGGDVVGTTDVVDAIKDLNLTKDTIAYVKGNCASAALWMASACKKRISNRTGQLGSIGVYSVYLDDSKQMEMLGVKEKIFRSSQSPDKNADPMSERGEQLIQVRMDDLCEEFIGDVAVNYNISTEKVVKSFGAGNMMVAKKALKAGMIDKIASFDDFIAQCAAPGGLDNYFTEENPVTENSATLNSDSSVKSSSSAETNDSAPISNENSEINGENMSKQKEEKPKAEENTADTNDNSQPQTENATEKETAPPADSAAAKTEPKADSSDLEIQFAKAQKEIAELKASALKNDLEKVCENFAGDKEKHLSLLTSLSNSFGRDSQQVKDYIELQNASAAQIEEGGLFSEKGKAGTSSGDTPLEKLNAKAAEIVKERKISKSKAFVAACEENPELYDAYNANR